MCTCIRTCKAGKQTQQKTGARSKEERKKGRVEEKPATGPKDHYPVNLAVFPSPQHCVVCVVDSLRKDPPTKVGWFAPQAKQSEAAAAPSK